jgi:hypothetical protein
MPQQEECTHLLRRELLEYVNRAPGFRKYGSYIFNESISLSVVDRPGDIEKGDIERRLVVDCHRERVLLAIDDIWKKYRDMCGRDVRYLRPNGLESGQDATTSTSPDAAGGGVVFFSGKLVSF